MLFILKIALKKIKISKKEWESIGKKTGWIKKSQKWLPDQNVNDPDWIINQLKIFIKNSENFWKNVRFFINKPTLSAKDRKNVLKDMLKKVQETYPNLEMFSKSDKKTFIKSIKTLEEKEKTEIEEHKRLDQWRDMEEVPQHLIEDKEGETIVQEREMTKSEPEISVKDQGDDTSMFATKNQIDEIKNSLLDRYIKKEITEDQLKMMLREFAKKNNLTIKLAKNNGKLYIKIRNG